MSKQRTFKMNDELIQELSQDQSLYFYKKVELVKRATGYNGIITNNNINDSDRIAKYNRENNIITISNKLINDCFLKTSEEYDDDFLTDIICYEIASTKYVRNSVYRTRLNKELYNKVKALESTQVDTINTENSEKTENAINTDNNISELTNSVIELDKLNKSNTKVSEKSREFLKEFNALSKDIIPNTIDNAIKNTNKALLRIKINNLMCFTYLLTQSICKFLQNSNKVPNSTSGFIRYMKFNFLGIVFNIQVIDGKIIYVDFGRLSMIVNNRCNYIAYDYVLDCYMYFSNIYYNIARFIINAYRRIHSNTYRKITSQHILLKQFCGSYAENHS